MSNSLLVKLETTHTQGDVVWVNPQHVSFVKPNPVHMGGGSVVYMVTSSRLRPDCTIVCPNHSPAEVRDILNSIPGRVPGNRSRIW